MALALTGRARNAAAAVSVLAAVALAIAVVGRGCRVHEPGPDAAVRSLIAAANAGDKKAVWSLLTQETRDAMTENAQGATMLVGSNVRYATDDLIAIGSTEDVPPPTDIHVESRTGDHAVVVISSTAGTFELDVEKEDGHWRIDLPGYRARSTVSPQ
jgi:hypothetical protein